MTHATFRTDTSVTKVDRNLGLVLGWAIVSKVDGQPYFDTQGDHIPEESMLKASTEFMQSARTAKAMHSGEQRGSIVFAWPMTEEIAKAYGIDTGGKYGLMVAAKFDDDTLAKFADGSYTGFSIGGLRGEDEEVEE